MDRPAVDPGFLRGCLVGVVLSAVFFWAPAVALVWWLFF